MFTGFNHFLSYGSTDQQTVRDLQGLFDGLVVPGTIAAFQAEGTKGFVLSLSARSAEPYVIDSRFPLFQNRLPAQKKSHGMLADILGTQSLLQLNRTPVPADFSPELIAAAAAGWLDFNIDFDDVRLKTFDKYASRLNEEVVPENKQQPAFVLPPYVMVDHDGDGWAAIGDQLWEQSTLLADARGIRGKLRRVIAASSSELWSQLAQGTPEREIVAWVSDLEEFRLDHDSELELIAYGRAIQAASERGQKVFALYGGFFSVLLARYGLTGSSHGIGFGEHRDWVELPSSGAPPARYYQPRLHRYISIDIADALWRSFPNEMRCDCPECAGQPPIAMEYHGLMRHSVRMRALEIEEWVPLSTAEVVEKLEDDFALFRSCVAALPVPAKVLKRAEGIHLHLAKWARVMTNLG